MNDHSQVVNYVSGMSESDVAIREGICQRFILAQEATGLSKKEFAKRVGLNSQRLSNIATYRNPPPHEAISKAVREFGFTADWFYFGLRSGFRDQALAERLRLLEEATQGKFPPKN